MRNATAVFLTGWFVLALCSAPARGQGDPNSAAEQLWAAATAAVQQAERAPSPADANELYTQADGYLQAIVQQYPSSQRAARLVLGDPLQRDIRKSIAITKPAAEQWVKDFALQIDRELEELRDRLAVLDGAMDDAEWNKISGLARSVAEDLSHPKVPRREGRPLEATAQAALTAAGESLARRDWDGAARWADRALVVSDGENPAAVRVRSDALFAKHSDAARAAMSAARFEDATVEAQSALAVRPDDSQMTTLRNQATFELHAGLARQALTSKRFTAARLEAEAALTVAPANSEMANVRDLGTFYELDQRSRELAASGDPVMAMDLLEQAVALRSAAGGLGLSVEAQSGQDQRLNDLKITKVLSQSDQLLSQEPLDGTLVDKSLISIEELARLRIRVSDLEQMQRKLTTLMERPGRYWGSQFNRIASKNTATSAVVGLMATSDAKYIFASSSKKIMQISVDNMSQAMLLQNIGTMLAIDEKHKSIAAADRDDTRLETVSIFRFPDGERISKLLFQPLLGRKGPYPRGEPDAVFGSNDLLFVQHRLSRKFFSLMILSLQNRNRPVLLKRFSAFGIPSCDELLSSKESMMIAWACGRELLLYSMNESMDPKDPLMRIDVDARPLSFSADGAKLAVVGGLFGNRFQKAVSVIDTNTGKLIHGVPIDRDDGVLLLTPDLDVMIHATRTVDAEGCSLKIFYVASSQQMRSLPCTNPITSMIWLPGKHQFVTGHEDGSISVWGLLPSAQGHASAEAAVGPGAAVISKATVPVEPLPPEPTSRTPPELAKSSGSVSKDDRKVAALPAGSTTRSAVRRLTEVARLRAEPSSSSTVLATPPAGTPIEVVGQAADGDWLELRYQGGRGFVATRLTAPAEVPPRELVGAAEVMDTATIRVDRIVAPLFGVSGVTGAAASRMGKFVMEQGGSVSCTREGVVSYRCRLGKVDLAEAALLNGAARAAADAPEEYRKREDEARRARRGVWAQ